MGWERCRWSDDPGRKVGKGGGVLLVLFLVLVCAPRDVSPQHPAGGEALPQLEGHVGSYRVAPQGTMALSRFGHGERTVYLLTDFTDGWRGVLHPLAGDTFAILPHEGPPPSAAPRVVLRSTGRGAPALELLLRDRPPRLGTHLDVSTRPVRFRGDAVELAGEVVLPPGPGPHPGIVFVHGSGPATRDDYREWSWFFAANGIAALIYDKRGAGGSTGDHRSASFQDLAADARAAVEALRRQPEVLDDAVGLSGGSQGAWVSPLTEAMTGRLPFLVLTGGGPVTPAEQEIYRRARIVADSGFSASDVEAARRLVSLYFDYLGSGGGDTDLAARVSQAWQRTAEAPWFALLQLPASDPTVGEWPEGRRRFAAELFFDPRPSVAQVGSPTLAVLGAEDQGFPTSRVVEAYRDLLPPELLDVWVIPDVDHGFWVTEDPARGRHQSPRLFEGMLTWIWRQLEHPS